MTGVPIAIDELTVNAAARRLRIGVEELRLLMHARGVSVAARAVRRRACDAYALADVEALERDRRHSASGWLIESAAAHTLGLSKQRLRQLIGPAEYDRRAGPRWSRALVDAIRFDDRTVEMRREQAVADVHES